MASGWDRFKKRIGSTVSVVNDRVAPVARIVAEAGPVLLELRGATSPLGVVTAAATGLNAANKWIHENGRLGSGPVGTIMFPWSEGIAPQLVSIFDDMASDQWDTEHGFHRWALPHGVCIQLELGGMDTARVYARAHNRRLLPGVVDETALRETREEIISRLRSKWRGSTEIAIDSETPERTIFRASNQTPLPSPRAEEVLADTLPMIPDDGPGRCIMLTGEPGGGKTSMAAWLAQAVCERIEPDGRIIHLRPDLAEMDDTVIALVLDIMAPTVVLVDDVDKLEDGLPNRVIETIRLHSRLTILTANNGLDERVMDGSAVRCGRVDETFEVDHIGVDLIPTGALKRLSQEEWERVRTWPAAFQQELVRRIETRATRLNLEEMEHRIGMLVHSAGRIFRSAPEAQDAEE